MKKSLLRLEDICPGSPYGTEENLQKLRVISDYLNSENVTYQISLVPRFVDPQTGKDQSIVDISNPFIVSFNNTMNYMRNNGATFDLEGFTHQYGTMPTPTWWEFSSNGCTSSCPPDDPPTAAAEPAAFEQSYASSRFRDGFEMCKQAGFPLTSWVT